MGLRLLFSRGRLVAPQVLLLGDSSYSWMLFLVFGCLSLLCGFIGLPLPGTGSRALPDAVQRAVRDRKLNDNIASDVDCGASPRWVVWDRLIAGGPAMEPVCEAHWSRCRPWPQRPVTRSYHTLGTVTSRWCVRCYVVRR